MSLKNLFESPDFVKSTEAKDIASGVKLLTFRDGFQCYTHTSILETELIYNEVFVKKEYFSHSPPLQGMHTVVDVGANIGMFTLLSKRENPNLTVYSFEPIQETYEVLLRNIGLHGLKKVITQNVAIGSSDGIERTFTYYPNMAGNSTANPAYKEYEKKVMNEAIGKERTERAFISETRRAKVKTLSAIIREYQISSIDFLKVDTEGDECLVLNGINDEDFTVIGHIVVEVHTDLLYKEVKSRLSHLGYTLSFDLGLSESVGVGNLYANRG